MACGICGEQGHTRRRCPGRPAAVDLLGALAASVDKARAERPEQAALREAVEAGTGQPPVVQSGFCGACPDHESCGSGYPCRELVAADVAEHLDVEARLATVVTADGRVPVESIPEPDADRDPTSLPPDPMTVSCPACGSPDIRVLGKVEAGTGPHPTDVDMLVRDCLDCGGQWEYQTVPTPGHQAWTEPRMQGPNWVPWRTWRGPAEPLAVTVPGVYQLTAEEYHADPVPGGSLSNSDARRLTEPGCPALFRWEKDNGVRQISDAMEFGKLVHVLVLGKGDEIAVRPGEWDSWRKPAARHWRDAGRAAGRIVCTPEQMEQAKAMAAALLADEFAASALAQPGRTEQCLFWVDAETGVMRRSMIDHLPDRPAEGQRMVIVDYKTAVDVCPDDQMMRHVFKYGYHRQGATYLDGVLELGLADDAVIVFIFQQKEPPFLVTPVVLQAEWIRIGRVENRWALRTFAECLASGVWPGFAPDGPVRLDVPRWLEIRFDGVTA